jgi:hypothetical protein
MNASLAATSPPRALPHRARGNAEFQRALPRAISLSSFERLKRVNTSRGKADAPPDALGARAAAIKRQPPPAPRAHSPARESASPPPKAAKNLSRPHLTCAGMPRSGAPAAPVRGL